MKKCGFGGEIKQIWKKYMLGTEKSLVFCPEEIVQQHKRGNVCPRVAGWNSEKV